MVARRKQGNYAYYRIADEGVYSVCETVCDSLQNRFHTLHRLQAAITPAKGDKSHQAILG